MRIRIPWYVATSAAFIIAGTAFLAAHNSTRSAEYMSHGSHASSIPYSFTEFDYIESNNYTDYDEHDNAIVGWYYMSYPAVFVTSWQSGGNMRQYAVYSGSTEDANLANYFSTNSCDYYNDNFPIYPQVAAFEYGHTSYGGDKRFTVICINDSAYGSFSNPMDGLSSSTRTKGFQHEIGHALHLDHDTGEGVMDTCWCYSLHQNEVNYVAWGYAAGH